MTFKRHKDTIGYFNKNYVHTGIFPGELGRDISKAAKIRHASDYNDFYIAGKEETERQIQTAKKLIELADKFVSEK
ncbi:MAG: HEPN domain-containing protein [Lachnospiraceae bacterium]|nr:HEPN domain-containing protein [Lachnospiraceae bacterium]